MYYIKIYVAIILLTTITACSNQGVKTKTAPSKEESKSSAQELTLYKEAIIALNNDELDKAETLFIRMSELQPNIAGSWANLALIKIKQGELKQASAFANTALTKNPNMPQALNLSGYLAQQRGEINQAKSYYLQAITYKEDYALAHYNLALLFDIYFQDIAKAIEHYQWYLAYSEQKDEATENWLEGLKATMAASNS
jgi:tetratricopeptide (TPR) repeat protein